MKNPNPTNTTTDHLSQEQLLRYQADRMTAAEMHQAERHLLACALCSDALEGISTLQPQQATAAVADIKARLAHRLADHKRTKATTPNWWWAVAASVFLLVAAGIFILFDSMPKPGSPPLAQQEAAERNEAGPNRATNQQMEVGTPTDSVPEADAFAREQAEIQDASARVPQRPGYEDIALLDESVEEVAQDPQMVEILEVPDEEEVADIEFELKAEETRNKEQAGYDSKPIPPDPAAALAGRAAGVTVQKQSSSADTRMLSGQVTDSATGEALPGVGVLVKGTDTGTVTNSNGEYSLQLSADEAMLTFNYIGYKQATVAISDKTTRVMAALEADTESLSEVVITSRASRPQKSEISAASSVMVKPASLPKPAEGMRAYKRYIKQNLLYPEAAARAGIETVVVVSFVVETDGSLSQLQVIDSAGYGLDEEAMRLVKEGPKWLTAKLEDGTPIRYQSSIKVEFKLK